jgi:hypothetical protein
MSEFSVSAIHPSHVLVGAAPEVQAIVRVRVSGLGGAGVDVSLRLWTPSGATVTMLAERRPARHDLRDRAVRFDARTVAYAAGRWEDGTREYELAIELPTGRVGDEILAARLAVSLHRGVVGEAPIAVTWTDDEALAATRRADGHGPAAPSAIAELPTGPSPTPRHAPDVAAGGTSHCPVCDLRAVEGDRFCERCGQALGIAQKS